MLIVSQRQATSRTAAPPAKPIVCQRCSWFTTRCTYETANGSSNTRAAVSNATPCFRRLIRSFASSQGENHLYLQSCSTMAREIFRVGRCWRDRAYGSGCRRPDAHVHHIVRELLAALQTSHVGLASRRPWPVNRRHRPRNSPVPATKQQVQHAIHHAGASTRLAVRSICAGKQTGV